MDFVHGVVKDVAEHFEKHDYLTKNDYTYIVLKHRGRYESRIENKSSQTGNST